MNSSARTALDVLSEPVRNRNLSARALSSLKNGLGAPLHHVVGVSASDPAPTACESRHIQSFRESLIRQSEGLLGNHHNLFCLKNRYLGAEINWNFEYEAQIPTPMSSSSLLDYRDYSNTGDCKFVWELNRHHHLVVLGRAYRLTGRDEFAHKVIEDVSSWIQQCPYARGMNWRSPMELAIRLTNWACALEFLRPSGLLSHKVQARILPVVYKHLSEISRKYSRYSSANNHLVGEAAGVFLGSTYFKSFGRSAAWRQKSREILYREIFAQTCSQGGHCELSLGYQLFVMQFFLLAGLAARRSGDDFPPAYWKRLEIMFDFVARFAEAGGRLPSFNDCDDGYVLDLGARGDFQALLNVGAVLFGRPDFKVKAKGVVEPVYWLFGNSGLNALDRLDENAADKRIHSHAFAESGRYLLQFGDRDNRNSIGLVFDCGELGFGSIAAHGHADALSFSLRANGNDVFVDSGTFDYFMDPHWRNYFRSTRAHNTIEVDRTDQSEMMGLFLWGRRAECRCLEWSPSTRGGTVVGEHDGYGRLPDAVVHRRAITLDGPNGDVVVRDELTGGGQHTAEFCLHLAHDCCLNELNGNRFEVGFESGTAILEMDSQLSIERFCGSNEPIMGWVSYAYHEKLPTNTLVGGCQWTGRLVLTTRIQVKSKCT